MATGASTKTAILCDSQGKPLATVPTWRGPALVLEDPDLVRLLEKIFLELKGVDTRPKPPLVKTVLEEVEHSETAVLRFERFY
jgi:hypothetical protein